jgi:hypothetical protein
MIVFGWGSGAKSLGDGFIATCRHCSNTRPFSVVETSRKITLYWLPVAKWNKQYYYICPVCSHGFEIPSKELAQRILAAAFRDPYHPDPTLAADLQKALRSQTPE